MKVFGVQKGNYPHFVYLFFVRSPLIAPKIK